jgi:hypothetical protein
MAQSSLSIPLLANNPQDRLGGIKETIGEMKEQVELLRTRKVGATVVESEAVNSLYFLLKRISGEVARLGMVL